VNEGGQAGKHRRPAPAVLATRAQVAVIGAGAGTPLGIVGTSDGGSQCADTVRRETER
jgi:hypothetical protein